MMNSKKLPKVDWLEYYKYSTKRQMYIKNFSELSKKDVAIAGGKGASLGEMTQNGISVPSGFVVLAKAFDRFLEETDLGVETDAILKRAKHSDIHSVERASEEIRGLIRDAEFPKDIAKETQEAFVSLNFPLVAVRSSATAEDSSVASWAGELESYLNVTKDNLFELIKKCWASLFTSRAIFYRFEKEMHDQKVSVAVVVQKMVQSDISGIAFTVHPVTKDKDQLIIEAGYGLGEAIVGGMITPDTYVVSKKEKTVLDKNVSEQKMMIKRSPKGTEEAVVQKVDQNKQKLKDEQILELAEICQGIEEHYKKPQDIEWALEKGKFYVVQSRPITTL